MANNEISFADTLKRPCEEMEDEGFKEIINYMAGDLLVEADGEEHLVKNQGSYQAAYIITSNDVHHSKQGFPNIRTGSSVNETADLVFYPYSTELCDMQGRLRMKKSESHFHYHSGRQARLVLRGRVKMLWIQNNSLHEVELAEDDWIVIPANTPYKTIVLEEVDMLSNWISFAPRMKENKLNTIGRFKRLPPRIEQE